MPTNCRSKYLNLFRELNGSRRPPCPANGTLTAGVDSVVGTSNDDVFNAFSVNASTGVTATTLSAFDTIDGGAGTDTLNIYSTTGANEVQEGTVRNVEIINIFNQTAGAEFGNAAGTVDASRFQGAQQIWQIGNAIDVSNIAAATTIGLRNIASTTVDLEFDSASANVVLENVADGTAVRFFGETLTTATVSGSIAQDAVASVVEVLELHDHTENAAGTSDQLITTLNLSLTTRTEVDLSNEFDSLVTFNAVGSTAGLVVEFDGSQTALQAASFGGGVDNVTIADLSTFDSETLAVNLGAGNDIITITTTLQGGDEVTSLSMTLGAGRDQVTFTDLINLDVDATEETVNGIISITDFNGAQDSLNAGTTGTAYTITNADLIELESAGSLYEFLDYLAGNVAGGYAVFQYEGSTYVFNDDATAGLNSGDGLVQLVGFTGALNDTNFVA